MSSSNVCELLPALTLKDAPAPAPAPPMELKKEEQASTFEDAPVMTKKEQQSEGSSFGKLKKKNPKMKKKSEIRKSSEFKKKKKKEKAAAIISLTSSNICELFPALTLKDAPAPASAPPMELKKEDAPVMKKEAQSMSLEKKEKEFCGVKKPSSEFKKKKKSEIWKLCGVKSWSKLKRKKECEKDEAIREELARRYQGVVFAADRYKAMLRYPNGASKWLGSFYSQELAALVYDKEAFKVYGSQAALNYPHRICASKWDPIIDDDDDGKNNN